MVDSSDVVEPPARDLLARTVARDITSTAWPIDAPSVTDAVLLNAVDELVKRLSRFGSAIAAVPPGLDDHSLVTAVWNLTTLIATPVAQYDSGELIYPVEVRGGESNSSHYSSSKESQGLHTDGSLLSVPPSLAVLGCLSAASEGGETVLVDARDVYKGVEDTGADLIELLQSPHPFAAEDDGRQVRSWAPVVYQDNGEITLRYLRRYLVAGWSRAVESAPERLEAAYNAVDRVAQADNYQVEYALQRGQVIIWRNARFLHGRRPFREGTSRRRLIRIYTGAERVR